MNLSSNAFKFSPENSTVKLITQNQGGKLVVKVIDSGIGIPEEEQNSMFSPFYRTSNAVAISGTGLGLTIAKHYLD